MQLNLSQNQRIIVAFSYLLILLGLFKIVGGSIGNLAWDTNIASSVLFFYQVFKWTTTLLISLDGKGSRQNNYNNYGRLVLKPL